MKEHGNPVWAIDKAGRKYLCELDAEFCNKFEGILDCSPGRNRDVPMVIEELSEHERSLCWDVSALARREEGFAVKSFW